MAKKKWALFIFAFLCVALITTIALRWSGKENQNDKEIMEFTWEEYQAMTLEEQDAFFEKFESVEAFEAWKGRVNPTESDSPNLTWDKEGKSPDEYTWEEYQALSAEERDAFFWWFASEEAFTQWQNGVKPDVNEQQDVIAVWSKQGKNPDEYTWEEYQALTFDEQESFFQWFASVDAFESWMNAVKPTEYVTVAQTWNSSEKLPDEYSWEEYQALSPEEQDVFYQWFDSEDAFEIWMNEVKPEESAPVIAEWHVSGRNPDEYSWEEYQGLLPEEQEAFYQWFGSVAAFEKWMNGVKPSESTSVMEWNQSGKLPSEYTWEEYQGLSPEEQESFYQWFDTMEDFEAWMTEAKSNAEL